MTLHGCHDRRAFLPSLLVQDGWIRTATDGAGGEPIGQRTRVPRMVAIPFRMSEECQYVPVGGPDPGCAGCRWERKADAR